MQFSDKDLAQIQNLGIDLRTVQNQLEKFRTGFPEIKLSRIVDEGRGLKKLSGEAVDGFTKKFDQERVEKELVKFVPASGAASRMFKTLFNFLEGDLSAEHADIKDFYVNLRKFAFYEELERRIDEREDLSVNSGKESKIWVEKLLSENGLNYGSLPKALLPFHAYDDGSVRKAIDEHLVEGAQYCVGRGDKVMLHFTVSQEHMNLIAGHINSLIPEFSKRYQKTFEVSYSIQDPATNTIAVSPDNNPLRDNRGRLVFRPGGHGALLKNLNEIEADIVFIKNIDNVAAEWLIKDTLTYKKALAGILLQTQEKVFEYCSFLKEHNSLNRERESEIVKFLSDELGINVPQGFREMKGEDKVRYLFGKLNRPIRICGVVKSSNTGGGPFWVSEPDGSESLQLVETDQINKNHEIQLGILKSSRYANITDLICGIKDFEGRKFDLRKFTDPDAGFIAEKSMGSRELKAMELPGLWNGSMRDWNTMFVEVPITTFNPVKTVLDLLKPEHQGTVKY